MFVCEPGGVLTSGSKWTGRGRNPPTPITPRFPRATPCGSLVGEASGDSDYLHLRWVSPGCWLWCSCALPRIAADGIIVAGLGIAVKPWLRISFSASTVGCPEEQRSGYAYDQQCDVRITQHGISYDISPSVVALGCGWAGVRGGIPFCLYLCSRRYLCLCR